MNIQHFVAKLSSVEHTIYFWYYYDNKINVFEFDFRDVVNVMNERKCDVNEIPIVLRTC
jgi:hypothetical protein